MPVPVWASGVFADSAPFFASQRPPVPPPNPWPWGRPYPTLNGLVGPSPLAYPPLFPSPPNPWHISGPMTMPPDYINRPNPQAPPRVHADPGPPINPVSLLTGSPWLALLRHLFG